VRAPLRLLALCATAALAAVALRPDDAVPAAVPAATFVDGDFTHSNSRDGMSVLEHPNLAPGHSAEGTVTIVNTGALGGDFALSVDQLTDAVGPGGGSLSERLRLHVRDLQGQATGYDGDLGTLESLPLGYFSPGESHTYAIALSFPNGESDNAYAASSASMRLVWDAVQAEPPNAPATHGTGRDAAPPSASGSGQARPPSTAPLRLLVRVPRVQRVLQRQRLLVRTRCNRPCWMAARAHVRVGTRRTVIRTWRTRVHRGDTARPRVRLPRGLRRAARRALARGESVVYRVTFSARDGAGQRVVVKRRLIVRQLRDNHLARISSRPIGAAR
jgi:spore coat-associated protein N